MPDAVDTLRLGDETVKAYQASEVEKPRLRTAGATDAAVKLTQDFENVDTRGRVKFPDGTVMGLRSELVQTIDDFGSYTPGRKPGPWNAGGRGVSSGTPDTWTVEEADWSRSGIAYHVRGYNVDDGGVYGENSRHTGGSLPGDGLELYCPDPPFDLYVGFRIDSESDHEFNVQWNCEGYSYESYRNIVEYEPNENRINTGQKGPETNFRENDYEEGIDIPSGETIVCHVHQKENGHWEVNTLGRSMDTRYQGDRPVNITDRYRGWGFSIGGGNEAMISYMDLDG